VGPGTWLRFRVVGGAYTPWLEAGKLCVDDATVVLTGAQARASARQPLRAGLHWEDIDAVQVNDLDMVETGAGIAAGTSLIMAAATAELVIDAMLASLHINLDGGLVRGAVDYVGERILERPAEDSAALSPLDLDLEDGAGAGRPLFAPQAHRRNRLLLTFASDVGMDAAAPAGVGGVAAGLRINHVFEIGAGARADLRPGPSDGHSHLVASTPFLRMGLHMDLDAARRVALALGADVGLGAQSVYARFLFGVRVRLTDQLQLGLYPWNPANGGSRLNLIEMSWVM
jgi:hypothetical protein